MAERKFSLGIDVSEEKIYTLTNQTEQLLGELNEDIYIYTFYSPGKRQLRIVNLQGGESIGIYDTLGRQRASRKAYGESEEFELESGVYMIRIEGSSLVKGKVVVK